MIHRFLPLALFLVGAALPGAENANPLLGTWQDVAKPAEYLRFEAERMVQHEGPAPDFLPIRYQPDAVLDALAPFLEREKPASGEAPVQACYRYISNRPGQFDYRSALEAGLPIGSGEVESGHRYVIQDRLKIAGAWWKQDNAEKMLALRVVRANNDWEAYWQNPRKKAA